MNLDFVTPELQQTFAALVLLTITVLTGALIKALYTFVKTKTSVEQFQFLELVATSAVLAAEQGAIAGFVADKKATAIAIVNAALLSAGITGLTAEQIDAAIEAAVKEYLNPDRQSSKPLPAL